MNSIRISYPDCLNMGDVLNKQIVEELFGYKVERSTSYYADLSAIGSGLGNYQYSQKVGKRIKQFIAGVRNPSVAVWGTGFISYIMNDRKFFRPGIKFAAVRGELTRKRVETITGKPLDVPTGDAGLLASMLLKESVDKKYDVGVISHFREQDEPVFKDLVDSYDNAVFIDVLNDPISVIRQIAECRYILSSSLHGLILADSLRVPNLHIVVTSNLKGDGFKFDDYYSGYGVEHHYLDVSSGGYVPTFDYVMKTYRITDAMVENKKRALIDSFPFPVKK